MADLKHVVRRECSIEVADAMQDAAVDVLKKHGADPANFPILAAGIIRLIDRIAKERKIDMRKIVVDLLKS